MVSNILATCPPNASSALQEGSDLLACNQTILEKYYHQNDCCIVNLAECNNIEKAWEVRRNILDPKTLCGISTKI